MLEPVFAHPFGKMLPLYNGEIGTEAGVAEVLSVIFTLGPYHHGFLKHIHTVEVA